MKELRTPSYLPRLQCTSIVPTYKLCRISWANFTDTLIGKLLKFIVKSAYVDIHFVSNNYFQCRYILRYHIIFNRESTRLKAGSLIRKMKQFCVELLDLFSDLELDQLSDIRKGFNNLKSIYTKTNTIN